MKMKWNFLLVGGAFLMMSLGLTACAGSRQGVVCSEIEYRLNTMTYSPDQRAFMEEDLRACREEEARKRGEDGMVRQSIYERYASSDSTAKVDGPQNSAQASAPNVSVQELMGDSSEVKTKSIYDRYGSASENPADTSAASVGNFQ